MSNQNPTKTLDLTLGEANVIADALDIAVRNNGLKAAGNALLVFGKIQQAFAKELEAKKAGNDKAPAKKPTVKRTSRKRAAVKKTAKK